MTTPTLTLFCGLPGSGKTTLARRLETEGRGVRISTDEWQATLGVPHADGQFHETLQRTLYRHALRLLEAETDVILEDGLWTRAERQQKLADARAVGARIDLHVFDLPEDELWRRLDRRNAVAAPGTHPMTLAELNRATSVFEPPTPDELSAVDAYEIHAAGPELGV